MKSLSDVCFLVNFMEWVEKGFLCRTSEPQTQKFNLKNPGLPLCTIPDHLPRLLSSFLRKYAICGDPPLRGRFPDRSIPCTNPHNTRFQTILLLHIHTTSGCSQPRQIY